MTAAVDSQRMDRALSLAASVRALTPPNPWVGCVIEAVDGARFEGATSAAGGPHAEAAALAAAADHDLRGATAWVTLEPCSHHGRTPPCADALLAVGVRRVVVAIEDPNPVVAGAGLARLRDAGVQVELGLAAAAATDLLAPYLHHRRTGRPYVVLKLASSLDGRTAAPDGSSQWITGAEARADAHALRAESDAVIVGAGTVRADDPSLTVRDADAPRGDPLRVVLGHAPEDAKVHPCLEHDGPLDGLLDDLGAKGHLQVLVEGGAAVAHAFHAAGLVDQYVLYLAPALFGGDDARGLFAGAGAATIADVWRGSIRSVTPLGDDLRIDLYPEEPR
ncbi:MAG: bifunctional diaminohydroxyphosphoribosylaminopyrimidine deaminase/5-amino-6-(5-phosphoribosylamino)uracil reductase RibD [Acidimicrobiales bacterium]